MNPSESAWVQTLREWLAEGFFAPPPKGERRRSALTAAIAALSTDRRALVPAATLALEWFTAFIDTEPAGGPGDPCGINNAGAIRDALWAALDPIAPVPDGPEVCPKCEAPAPLDKPHVCAPAPSETSKDARIRALEQTLGVVSGMLKSLGETPRVRDADVDLSLPIVTITRALHPHQSWCRTEHEGACVPPERPEP